MGGRGNAGRIKSRSGRPASARQSGAALRPGPSSRGSSVGLTALASHHPAGHRVAAGNVPSSKESDDGPHHQLPDMSRAVFFTMPVAWRLNLKKPTATVFFTLAVSRWRKIIGCARVSTTEQNLGLRHDDLKPTSTLRSDDTDCVVRDSRGSEGFQIPFSGRGCNVL